MSNFLSKWISAAKLLCLLITLFSTTVFAQNQDVVLVKGNPPLTQLMVGKSIVLLDWMLDLKLNKEQEIQIQNLIVESWKQNNKAQMKSTLDVIDVYEQIVSLNETERNKVKARMQPLLLENLQKEPGDELSRIVLSAYNSSKTRGGKNSSEQLSPQATGTNKLRVGEDGFTGLYRMVRPKKINVNSRAYESGFYVEHIVFLPDGRLFWRLPPEGLLSFDVSAACASYPNDCGTYEIKGDEIHVLRGDQKTRYIITRNGERLNNPPSLGKGTFRRVPACDRVKLQGSYRRNQNEPSITFKQDGTFNEGGIFRFFGTVTKLDGTVQNDDGTGGSGTYNVEQNTLELKYSDGRTRRFVFEAFAENLEKIPAVDYFFVNGQRLERH